ncbi:hypothetical protein D1007_12381 [Hordeum vulgare]|nr:hypothetical protein D1007_12381 [Hordeum vulgare]
MAVMVQLCVGIYVLVYHIWIADEHCGLLVAFLLDKEYTIVGLDINNDQKKLKRVAGSIIHHSYNKMKDAITEDDRHIWAEMPLPLKNIYYASMDAYATYDVYMRLVNFQKGFES